MTTAHDAHLRPVVRYVVGAWSGAALVSAVVATALAGGRGLAGALLGAGLVLTFFLLGHLVLTLLRDIEPSLYLVIALLTYVLQVVALLAVFGSFSAWSDSVSAPALGLTIVACTIAWTTAMVAASRRQRIPLFDLEQGAR